MHAFSKKHCLGAQRLLSATPPHDDDHDHGVTCRHPPPSTTQAEYNNILLYRMTLSRNTQWKAGAVIRGRVQYTTLQICFLTQSNHQSRSLCKSHYGLHWASTVNFILWWFPCGYRTSCRIWSIFAVMQCRVQMRLLVIPHKAKNERTKTSLSFSEKTQYKKSVCTGSCIFHANLKIKNDHYWPL